MSLKILAKYLDQPALITKLNNSMPYVLTGTASGFLIADTYQTPKENRKKRFIKNASVLALTITSALLATKGLKIKGKQIFEGLIEEHHHSNHIKPKHKQERHIHSDHVHDHKCHGHSHHHDHGNEDKIEKTLDKETKNLIKKISDNEILSYPQVKKLDEKLNMFFPKKDAISEFIPNSHSHKPFEELKKLSLLGLVPVVGGVLGGVFGDVLTKDNWKNNLPNKVKEGTYQYLNNIFLCNVGAGIALFAMNKLNVQSKTVRFASMLAGVVGVGLVAGSLIANYFSKTLINPLFGQKQPDKKLTSGDLYSKLKELNNERTPEAVDLSLHIDDIASVGFLCGFKWIGPVLPALYSVSGYRAGIGYRNGEQAKFG